MNYDANVRLDAVNRRGRQIAIVAPCSALRNPSGTVRGCILTMEPDEDAAGPPGSAAT